MILTALCFLHMMYLERKPYEMDFTVDVKGMN